MLDPALLEKALSGDGKDAEDGRLPALESALADDPIAAAELARGSLEKGVTDVRFLAAYALGLFVEQGPSVLAAVFGALRKALTEKWAAVRPAERKERVVDGACGSLFRSIARHVDVHEKMQDATFKRWIRADHDTVGGPALTASAALREALSAAIPEARSTGALSEVDARIRTHFDRVAAPVKAPPRPAPEPEPEPQAEPAHEAHGDPADDHSEAPVDDSRAPARPESPRAPAPPRSPDATAPLGTVRVSPAFAQLVKKLDAFRALVEQEQYPRAAVIADDVRRTLKSFDPKVFFPDVFLPYFQALSTHIDQIAPCWDEMGSPRWEALEQLYQVDLDSFVEG